jgi:hypothetical protein
MAQQTAVEWLVKELTPSITLQQKYIDQLEKKAKEMEKEQKIEAYLQGSFDDGPNVNKAEQYYNETYKK